MKMYNCSLMIFLLAIGGLLLASCEKKEVMEYEGLDGIYFDVQYGAAHGDESVWARQNYTYVSFGTIEAEEADITMKVGIAGSVKDYDRPFRVEIVADRTTAIPEEEYADFSEEQVIKAGETHVRDVEGFQNGPLDKGHGPDSISYRPGRIFYVAFFGGGKYSGTLE